MGPGGAGVRRFIVYRRETSMKKGVAAVLAVATAAVLVVGGLALADTKKITDPKDAIAGRDIKTASHGHTNTGKLKHRITTYNAYTKKQSPCLEMKAGGDLYRICQSTITNLTTGKSSNTVGYRHPTTTSTVYVFSKHAIGNPSKYQWRAISFGSKCGEAFCDSAPNKGWVTHNL
jgi:hypothetical protein